MINDRFIANFLKKKIPGWAAASGGQAQFGFNPALGTQYLALSLVYLVLLCVA